MNTKLIEKLGRGDCLKLMKKIPDHSIDMILCDLPYGTTACKWDVIIPFEPLWEQYKRIIKDNGAIALTASQPFTSKLVMSNIEWFKYSLVWSKNTPTGAVHAKNKPLKYHEDVLIFSPGTTIHASQSIRRMTYNPQMQVGTPYRKTSRSGSLTTNINHPASKANIEYIGTEVINEGYRYPGTIINFTLHNVGLVHPTQKPVALFEYLIKTYTNEGEIVLDNCAGSGTTGVACRNLGRGFILIEKEAEYIEIIKSRLKEVRRA